MSESTQPQRPIDHWFARYAGDRRNPVNLGIHMIAVPLLLWSVIGLLWCIPVPGNTFRQGLWAALAMFGAWMFHYRAARMIGFGMLAAMAAMGWLTRFLHDSLGTPGLFKLALGVFVVAWGAQLVGNLYEGKRPGIPAVRDALLIGPAWLLAKLYRRLGVRW